MPTAGTVRYRTHDLSRFDDDALTRYRRDHVGFVCQFYNLIPSLTARENTALVTVGVGHQNESEAEILGGLTEGRSVVLHPSDRIEEGVAVMAR